MLKPKPVRCLVKYLQGQYSGNGDSLLTFNTFTVELGSIITDPAELAVGLFKVGWTLLHPDGSKRRIFISPSAIIAVEEL
jgi:hypothetical protein